MLSLAIQKSNISINPKSVVKHWGHGTQRTENQQKVCQNLATCLPPLGLKWLQIQYFRHQIVQNVGPVLFSIIPRAIWAIRKSKIPQNMVGFGGPSGRPKTWKLKMAPNGPKWCRGLKKSPFWSPKWPPWGTKSIPERPLDVKKCYKTTSWPGLPRSSKPISKTANRNVQETILNNSTRHGGGDCPQGNWIIFHPRSAFVHKSKALDELYRSRGVPGYIGAIHKNKTTLFFCMVPFLTGEGGICLYGFAH